MLLRILAILSILAMPTIAAPANAQGLNPYLETLNKLNDIKPMQNPNWERSSNTLKSRVLDKKNKVIGDLNDIIITPQGTISTLNVDLNRLQLGEVPLNYSKLDIEAAPRAYTMEYAEEQIEEFYPELLANIDTAAGNTASQISVKSLVGSSVYASDGRRIGDVEEVMFSERGERAEALLIRVNYKTVRGENVAIPFSSAKYEPNGSRFKVSVSNSDAETILQFADDL